jgi:plasmid stability protein
MIQIRNVPDDLHRRVKARAALAGMSMSEYILRELQRSLERPTLPELLEQIASLPSLDLGDVSVAEIIREERDRR